MNAACLVRVSADFREADKKRVRQAFFIDCRLFFKK